MFQQKNLSVILWIILILAFIIPYSTTIVPEQKVQAVDKIGIPIPNATFRQIWDHYSYEVGGTEFLTADENGYVELPERKFTAPLIYRIIRSGFAYSMLIAHGSVGAGGTVNALSDKCSSGLYEYNSSKALPDVIILGC